MESRPQNPEFRIYPENFHPWSEHKQSSCHVAQVDASVSCRSECHFGRKRMRCLCLEILIQHSRL